MMRPSYLLLLPLVFPMMAQTTLFTFGVKAGVPAQTPFQQSGDRIPFVLGPAVDIGISSRLSIETGVLFQRIGQQPATGVFLYPENAVTTVYSIQSASALGVPILAKVQIRSEDHTWRPFITLGPTVQRTSFDTRALASILSGTPPVISVGQPALSIKRVDWSFDPTVGVGLDFKTSRFHLEPEVRYSYWVAGQDFPIRKNQVDFLIGFRF